jgi:hypothetical protein
LFGRELYIELDGFNGLDAGDRNESNDKYSPRPLFRSLSDFVEFESVR